jgi:hypothetical protein
MSLKETHVKERTRYSFISTLRRETEAAAADFGFLITPAFCWNFHSIWRTRRALEEWNF